MRLVFQALALLLASNAFAAPLELRLVGADGAAIAGTVVLLRSIDAARPVAHPVDAQIDQVDRQFVPNVLVVPTGSKIVFPNSDSVRHQVYSFSPAKRFQLPLYRGTPYAPVDFDHSGVVTLGCNIHDQMRAYVFVVDAQYYGRTDSGGAFRVPDVQAGIYTVQIWHPLARDTRPVIDQQITVVAPETRLTLRLGAPLRLRPESQVPANWDAY
ncbi:MAG: methylamine utilization protein [Steroidobacteraceae bacterium]